ncbi:MAG: hypothetical protein K8R31_02660 [Bacteroidales bacterium]|nr:hypothetical protein [Bacteroidales bacterium]
MEVKGTAVKSIKDFVEKKHNAQFNDWIQSLPESSQNIMTGGIFANNWYPMKEAAVEPTKAIAKLFYKNDIEKAAFEAGRYSAETGLKGVYKIFVRIASPSYIMQRASRIIRSYYNPSEIIVKESHDKGVILHITKFPNPDPAIEYRIAGWIEHALEITNCKGVKSSITKSMTKGDPVTEITSIWN